MKFLSRSAWSRRGFVRNVAAAIVVTAPIVILPIMAQSGASATDVVLAKAMTVPTGSPCAHGELTISDLTVHSDATVTVSLAATDCDFQKVSLVSYVTHGPDYETAGIQTRYDKNTQYVTSAPKDFSVAVPDCFFQIDLIYGDDAPLTLQDHELYFTNHGTLIVSYNAAKANCGGPSSSGSPSSSSSSTASASSTSTSPSGSVSPSGSTTTTVTKTSTGTPSGSSTATASVSDTSTATASGSSTATASVSGTSTTNGATVSPTTNVSGISFTQAAQADGLPNTGMPISAMVLLGLELMAGGTLAVLVVRRRSGGTHR